MTPSATDEQRLRPTQRALSSTFSNRGNERSGFLTTLYRVHKLLSVWLGSARFSVPEEADQQRPGVEGATDSSAGQYGAPLGRETCLRVRALSYTEVQAARLSWERSRRIQTNAGNTIRPCRRNGEQAKWEPTTTKRSPRCEDNIKVDLKQVWTGFIWLRLYWPQQWTTGLYGMTGIDRVDEQLSGSQQGQMPLRDGDI
jgi:hypothetical protein